MKRKKLLLITSLLIGLTFILLCYILFQLGVRPSNFREFVYIQTHKPPKLSPEQKTELHTWIKENAVHLKTVDAGSGFKDLQPLKNIIGYAQVVGLGELPHLVRQFYQVKHRIVEFLVEEMDFTVFAIEGPFAGALELNDYILTGDGDPERALAALVYPAWITEEVLEMVKWMREYNTTHEKKVKFYGFDDKPAQGSAAAVYDYLKNTNGTSDYDQLLLNMAYPLIASETAADPKAKNISTAEKVQSLIKYLEDRPPADTQNIRDQKQYQLIIQHAKILLQFVNFLKLPISEAAGLRDIHMAENARWIKEHEDNAKIILWAANPHICAPKSGGNMGGLLRKMYGDDFVVFALISNRGFEAFNIEPSTEGATQLSTAKQGSLAETLAQAGLNIAILDFDPLPKGIVTKYFNAPLENLWVYPRAYDAVLFVESTCAARPTAAGEIIHPEKLDTPSNLNFELFEDNKPKDWTIRFGQSRAEYLVESSNDQPYEGSVCAVIKRRPGKTFGQSTANFSQSIKTTEFKGKKMQFSAAAKITEGNALLWLEISTAGQSDITKKQLITSDQWQRYNLSADVPQKASKITYGFSYVGHGAAFIDDIKIETQN